jgi:hypothetical protein
MVSMANDPTRIAPTRDYDDIHDDVTDCEGSRPPSRFMKQKQADSGK